MEFFWLAFAESAIIGLYMRRVASLLLAVAIFGCPLVCAWGHAGGGKAAQWERGGCSCCHHEDALPSEGSDCPSQPGSDSPCQCVCGGAVLGDTAQFDVGLDVDWSLPVVVADGGVVLAVAVENNSWIAAPWPDVGMNRGRWMCCLFCTYLC